MHFTRILLVWATLTAACFGKTLSTSSLIGKYFVRHLEFTTDNSNKVTDARSITGAITFDGTGKYTFSGQQVIGTVAAAPFATAGMYSVSPGGIVLLTNPQMPAVTINARYSTEAVIGSSTEGPATTFDLFVAIPATGADGTTSVSTRTLDTRFHLVDFELTNGSTAQVRVSGMAPAFDSSGTIGDFQAVGHGASIAGGATQTGQQYTGTWSVNTDGTGAIEFLPAAGLAGPSALLSSASRSLMLAADGNLFLAATPGAHDILIGIRDGGPHPVRFAGEYWRTGIRVDATGASTHVGSMEVLSEITTVLLTLRSHDSDNPAGPLDITAAVPYVGAVGTAGAGNISGNTMTIGAEFAMVGTSGLVAGVHLGEKIVGDSDEATGDPAGFEISFGVPVPKVTAHGVFVNPDGIVNTFTLAPAGDSIAPGESISISGTDLADEEVATNDDPIPTILAGVKVSINGLAAAVYSVSPNRIDCIAPEGLTGNSASIIVTNHGIESNAVTVGESPTSPGIVEETTREFGAGALFHADRTVVDASNPAMPGEMVTMYVTGLGSSLTLIPLIEIDKVVTPSILRQPLPPNQMLDRIGFVLPPNQILDRIDFVIPDAVSVGQHAITLLTHDAVTQTAVADIGPATTGYSAVAGGYSPLTRGPIAHGTQNVIISVVTNPAACPPGTTAVPAAGGVFDCVRPINTLPSCRSSGSTTNCGFAQFCAAGTAWADSYVCGGGGTCGTVCRTTVDSNTSCLTAFPPGVPCQ